MHGNILRCFSGKRQFTDHEDPVVSDKHMHVCLDKAAVDVEICTYRVFVVCSLHTCIAWYR